VAAVIQLVMQDGGVYYGKPVGSKFLQGDFLTSLKSAASDSRKNGVAAGY
jgi:hypothetical protein